MINKTHCILIVDDEPLNRELMESCLELAGCDSRAAASGAEALAMLGPEIDLVLLDVNMPGMTGFETAERIRAHPTCGHVPIIMVTALTAKADRLKAVECGANDFIAKPVDDTELRVRMASLLKMKLAQDTLLEHQEELERRVAARTEDLLRANAKLEMLATRDPLTELFNHRAVMTALAAELDRAERHSRSCAVLFLNLDHFKSLNDRRGHGAGDAVLSQIGAVAAPLLRSSDTLGRWGGEEFAIILPETERVEAMAIAEAMRVALGTHVFSGSADRVTGSIGLAMYPADGQSPTELAHAADRAMTAATRLGRNQSRSADDPAAAAVANWDGGAVSDVLYGEVTALAMLVSARDCYTGRHNDDVAEMAARIALVMGATPEEAHVVRLVGQLHDIGKVAIPDSVLQKSSSLTEEEWAIMREHPVIGADILNHMPVLKRISASVRAHHERWDGAGYPDRLSGEDIPLAARIVAVADTFGAITSDRPYRKGRSVEAALAELRACANGQFDSVVVDAVEVVAREMYPLKKAA